MISADSAEQRVAESASAHRSWLRRRATPTRYRVAEGDLVELLAHEAVVAGGISAAAACGLGLSHSGEGEVHVGASAVAGLVDEFFPVESTRGNLLVRVEESGEDWHLRTARVVDGLALAPRLVVAVDLLDSADTRSRSAGKRLLAEALSLVRGEG
ncbi:hypothetical protein [Actinosynnema sp.]|uniref:hypothetical protein n=1 Tax=Actinosynnema sp. TaxID=1872144 RepID=UPI003F86625C